MRLCGRQSDVTTLSVQRYGNHIMPVYEAVSTHDSSLALQARVVHPLLHYLYHSRTHNSYTTPVHTTPMHLVYTSYSTRMVLLQ